MYINKSWSVFVFLGTLILNRRIQPFLPGDHGSVSLFPSERDVSETRFSSQEDCRLTKNHPILIFYHILIKMEWHTPIKVFLSSYSTIKMAGNGAWITHFQISRLQIPQIPGAPTTLRRRTTGETSGGTCGRRGAPMVLFFFFSIGDSCYIKLYPFLFLNGDVFPLLLALFGKWAGFTIRDGDQSDFADLDHRDLIYFWFAKLTIKSWWTSMGMGTTESTVQTLRDQQYFICQENLSHER